jgi:signal transduction histidine kinase
MTERTEESWELLRSGEFEGAREKLAPLLEDSSPPLDVLHNYAVCCYKIGKFTEAHEVCRRALASFPDSHRTRYLLGVVLKESGEMDAASEVLSELVEASPDSPRAYYHRGTCHFMRGRSAEAAADLERAAALDPINLAGRYNLGVVHVATRQWEKAREDFTACLRLDPAGAEEYAGLLVEIGRAQVCERVYGQGHRLKNMLGIVGDRLKTTLSDVRSRLSNGERGQLDEITSQQDLIFSDLAAFLATLQPSPLELDLVDVREIVARALFTASPSTRHLTVEKHLGEAPEVVCDVESIHEAFLNIILNAAEAMPGGGTLTVSLTRPDDESVAVSFRDTGPGIDPEMLPRIFQFGYSTKVFGSGLGLSQARESVRLHGGRIDVESATLKGATFTVILPLSPEIHPTVQDLTLRPVLFEDPQELMLALAEDEGLLMM